MWGIDRQKQITLNGERKWKTRDGCIGRDRQRERKKREIVKGIERGKRRKRKRE